MCGRFNQHSINIGGPDGMFEQRLLNKIRSQQMANISPGMLAYFRTNQGPMIGEFGYKPHFDPKKLFINARIEGQNNPENKPDGWEIGITSSASFKKSFIERRCVIPVSSFIEGPEKEKLSKPYLIKTEDDRPFFLGGIYREYTNNEGEITPCFAILTGPAIAVCAAIGHHRSPVLVYEDTFENWLNPEMDIEDIGEFLKSGYEEPGLMSYALDPALIKSGKLHDPEILKEYKQNSPTNLFS